ncbi:MAG: hypothetical protein LBL70_03910 [Treponema sp.]|jgi:hypothetical protein|nr:hypothetical protein [Treponema sp.]
MKKFMICVLALSLGFSARPFPGFTQTSSGTGSTASGSSGGVKPSLGFDTSEFPLWAKDLRRAEIVTFGSFPFTVFFSTFAADMWRCYSHDWDPLYAPWPAKPPGAINMTQDELAVTLTVAAALSVAIAVTDFSIVQIRRHREKQRVKNLPAGSPIRIIRKPAAEDEASGEPEAVPEPAEPASP